MGSGGPSRPETGLAPAGVTGEPPRERLLRRGATSLDDAELVGILLRVGCRGRPVARLAAETLAEHGGLDGLRCATLHSLRRHGLGEAKAALLLAAVELGVRLSRGGLEERRPLSRPATAARYLTLRYACFDQEVMGALFLDSRQRLVGERELFRGTLARAAVEPRPILRHGLQLAAAGLILFHTHPSGDPTPSAEDLAFTRRLDEAGELVGIRLVDHLVLGTPGRWVSLRERGGW